MQQTRPLPVVAFFIDFLESDEGLAGGTERQLIGILRELPKWGFRPVLFCLRGDRRALAWRSLDCEKHMLGVTSLR
ncbi:MAG: hypothetical protein RBU25_16600, partial [Lentisphaeria bacterium]|nr:hypothetical protein [Lentisphaeria bacterium]